MADRGDHSLIETANSCGESVTGDFNPRRWNFGGGLSIFAARSRESLHGGRLGIGTVEYSDVSLRNLDAGGRDVIYIGATTDANVFPDAAKSFGGRGFYDGSFGDDDLSALGRSLL